MGEWKKGADIDLRKGDVVKAIRTLDEGNVPMGAFGIVFEDTDAFDDGNGPMVRFWYYRGSECVTDGPTPWRTPCCNVYTGDVVRTDDRPLFDEDEFGNAVIAKS